MKHLFSFFLALTSLHCFAQRTYHTAWSGKTENYTNDSRSITDTIRPWGTNSVTPNLFVSQNGGYLVGVNGYGDKQAAQIFMNNFPLQVTGALFWFGKKNITSGNSSSSVTFRLFALDSSNLSNAVALNAKGPGTILSSVNVSATNILADTSYSGGMNFISFPSPVTIDSGAGFVLGFSVTSLAAGDTVGLMSTADGDGGGKDFSIQQWSNGKWNSFLDPNNWDSDLDLYILAITEHEPVSIGNVSSNEKEPLIFPNPNSGYFVVDFDEKHDIVKGELLNMNGEKILNLPLPQHGVIYFDRHDVSGGTYIVQLWNETGRNWSKKIVVE